MFKRKSDLTKFVKGQIQGLMSEKKLQKKDMQTGHQKLETLLERVPSYKAPIDLGCSRSKHGDQCWQRDFMFLYSSIKDLLRKKDSEVGHNKVMAISTCEHPAKSPQCGSG